MAFHDVRLPEEIERGSVMGPRFLTTIVPLVSGREQRNRDWTQELFEADISYGIMGDDPDQNELTFLEVVQFFRERWGRAYGFRFKDWTDFVASEQPIGTGDGVKREFALGKWYGSYFRRLTRPVWSTVKVFVDDTQVAYTQSPDPEKLGYVIIAADAVPANGTTVTWTGEFDIPVRFDSDTLQVNVQWARAGSIPSITIKGIRETDE